MGAKDQETQGFFTNTVKGFDFDFSPGCGGFGAGACYLPAGFRYMAYSITNSGFVVKNRQLILQNIDFKQYANGGNDGICANSNGASLQYDVYLAYDWNGTAPVAANLTAKRTIDAAATLPFYMRFNELEIPQPSSLLWTGLIWVIVDLGATGHMIGGKPADSKLFKVTNHDYDERL